MNSCARPIERGRAAARRLPRIVLALEQEAVERRGQPLAGGAAVVRRVGFVRAGQRHARRMVQVFVEEAVHAVAAVRHRPHQPRVLRLVLGDDDHRSRRRRLAGDPRQRGEDVLGRDVVDLLRGVDAEAVEVELAHPVGDVRQHQLAQALAVRVVEVERLAPLVRVPAAGVPARELRQVVAGRAEVVVDDVEDHGQAEPVRGVDEVLEIGGRAVAVERREPLHAVVAPAEARRRTPPPASSGSPSRRRRAGGAGAPRPRARCPRA